MMKNDVINMVYFQILSRDKDEDPKFFSLDPAQLRKKIGSGSDLNSK